MLTIEPIHALGDNFIWLLKRDDSQNVAVVDPGEAAPVLDRLTTHNMNLMAILITHKHGDHIGGVEQLKIVYPDVVVFGPKDEPIRSLDQRLTDGQHIQVPGIDTRFSVLDVRGHTEGHIAYYDGQHLFCGDTLFSIGCGRVFSGGFDQLHDALMRIRTLPDETQVYCAHEYTLDNIGFAKWVEPNNPRLLAYEANCHTGLSQKQDTIPCLLGTEKAANPFLRINEPSVLAALQHHLGYTPVTSSERFRALRIWKDNEYD